MPGNPYRKPFGPVLVASVPRVPRHGQFQSAAHRMGFPSQGRMGKAARQMPGHGVQLGARGSPAVGHGVWQTNRGHAAGLDRRSPQRLHRVDGPEKATGVSDLSARVFVKRRIPPEVALTPVDDGGFELLSSIRTTSRYSLPCGARVISSITNSCLRLSAWWCNTDKWVSNTTFLQDLKLATGLFETRISGITGVPYIVAGLLVCSHATA